MSEEFCYLGRKKCGCLVAAMVVDPDDKRDVERAAKEVASWIREGYAIETTTDLPVTLKWGCNCTTTPQMPSLFDAIEAHP